MATNTPTPTSASTSTSSIWIPTPTADPSYEHKGPTNGAGLKRYYFSFLALVVVVAVIVAVLLVRRARKRAQNSLQHERQVDLWNHRASHSAGVSPDHIEEGLNENGEAPPPYAPPPPTEEMGNQTTRNEPAVPMRTLSRNVAGLKPPEYTEVNVRSV